MKDFCYSSLICNTKDKTAVLSNLFVVCDFSCPDLGANYIAKTEINNII